MKKDVVSNEPVSFSCHMFTHDLVCDHKKVSEIDDQITCLVSSPQCHQPGLQFDEHRNMYRVWSSVTNNCLYPNSDSMLCQHIFDVNSWCSCLLLLFLTLFLWICIPLTDQTNSTPFQKTEISKIETPFSESIPGENIKNHFCFSFCQNPSRDPPSFLSTTPLEFLFKKARAKDKVYYELSLKLSTQP
jgi:hypothetical protein